MADPEPTVDVDGGAAGGYPARWEADVVLADGGTISVRPIRPDDAERIVAFHDRQSPESIYFRFFSPRPRLSESDVERFTQVDYQDRMAFIGLLGDEMVGVARYDRHRGRSDAEVAFFIDDEHHGRGIATVLLEYLAVAARESGISGFTASVLPQNRKMLGVFTQAGFRATSHFEGGIIEVELDIDPTPEALAAIEERAALAQSRSVERLLKPTSVAVIGASRQPGSIGHEVFRQLVSHGFQGPVYPVNTDATYVSSVRAWRSVLDVPGELDLAILCVPREQVQRVAEECAVKRVQGLVVLTAGFAERDEEGAAAEVELVSYARRHGMRLIGPSALGIINTDPAVSMHATFVPVEAKRGRVGLISQSGVVGAAIIDSARLIGLGISSFVAVGNKADVSSNDLLRYWQDDPDTDVAMMYLESFGNPANFSRRARELSAVKPVVAVKVGGDVGERWTDPPDWPAGATASALFGQTGIVRVDNLTQMLHTASVLAHQPLPAGRRVTVVTNSWGPGWLAVDALRGHGLVAPDPVDLDNTAEPHDFAQALRRVYAAGTTDAVLVIYAPALRTHYRRVAAAVREAAAEVGAVTTVACMLGEHRTGLLSDEAVDVPEFPFPEEAAAALGRVADYVDWRSRPVGEVFVPSPAGLAEARRLVADWLPPAEDATAADLVPLGPLQGDLLLRTVGLQTVPQGLAADVDAVIRAAHVVGYPVAIKASGLDRLTTTEAGGVSLDVHGDDEARDAYTRMHAALGEAMEPAVVQAMVAEGVSCRVGLHRHPVLGDLLTLGPGGAQAERSGDLAMQLLPVTDADAERLVDRSVVGPLLDDQGPKARAALVDLLVRVAALADTVPEICALRLNPVIVSPPATDPHDRVASITDARFGLRRVVPDPRPPVRRL